MSALSGREPFGERGIGRRALLALPVPRVVTQRGEVKRSQYAGWIAHYRRGRLQEVAAEVREWGTRELLSAQRDYLEALGDPDTPRGLGARLTTALFHAEAAAHFGMASEAEQRLHLVGEPLRSIRVRWPDGMPSVRSARIRERGVG